MCILIIIWAVKQFLQHHPDQLQRCQHYVKYGVQAPDIDDQNTVVALNEAFKIRLATWLIRHNLIISPKLSDSLIRETRDWMQGICPTSASDQFKDAALQITKSELEATMSTYMPLALVKAFAEKVQSGLVVNLKELGNAGVVPPSHEETLGCMSTDQFVIYGKAVPLPLVPLVDEILPVCDRIEKHLTEGGRHLTPGARSYLAKWRAEYAHLLRKHGPSVLNKASGMGLYIGKTDLEGSGSPCSQVRERRVPELVYTLGQHPQGVFHAMLVDVISARATERPHGSSVCCTYCSDALDSNPCDTRGHAITMSGNRQRHPQQLRRLVQGPPTVPHRTQCTRLRSIS
jgi:hypothetical protein